MMMHETILKMSDPLLRAACDLARQRELTVGQVIRDALTAELARTKAPKARPLDDKRRKALRERLATDVAAASGWDDLDDRLRRLGFTLLPSGGGLALYSVPDGTRVCKGSEVGLGYGLLARRFGRRRGEVGALYHVRPAAMPDEQAVIDF